MPVQKWPSAHLVIDGGDRERLEWQVWPEEINESKSVDWSNVAIIGRAEPYLVYSSSGPRIFTFTLGFMSSVDGTDTGEADEVRKSMAFIESLAYPDVSHGIVVPPPTCILVIGKLLDTRVVLTNYNFRWLGPWELSDAFVPDLPMRAEATITLQEILRLPPTSSEVRRGVLGRR